MMRELKKEFAGFKRNNYNLMTDKIDDDDLFEGSSVNYIEERNHMLRDVDFKTVRRAWFNLSHLLVQDGATILDMGSGDGELTYAMAALNPKVNFIGIDKSKRAINESIDKYKAPNLEFKVGDISGDVAKPESVDAIINSLTLHHVFSEARYNERIITDTLRKQFSLLKNDGIMFIRDFAKPPQGQFVLMEMHDEESKGDSLSDLSEADLLVWYSEHARPKQDPGCGGFFLEELPPRFPRTRLFRLPYKWAYEFIMRKDNRDIWENELPFEYTYYTVQEFRNDLKSLGARVQYSAPHWDEDHIKQHFEGHFRLLGLNGEQLGDPPTGFIAVARKQPERTSLNVQERRITDDEDGVLEVKTLRDQKNGDLVDVVTREREWAEILPYRINEEDKRLYIYLHDGIVRGIANAVRRSGANIDEREWSGHMLEPITTDYSYLEEMGEFTPENTEDFAKTFLGLTPRINKVIEGGAAYYPDPNYIDERIHTYYLNVSDIGKVLVPKRKVLESHRFQAKGIIREYNAQSVLDAITVGLIPNSRLELQILSLMQHVKLKAENWISKDISIASGVITKPFQVKEFMRMAGHNDKRFKEVKGAAGQLKTINSIFVEEGLSQGGRTGISSEHVDFVLSDEKTINTAVVLPLTKSLKGDIHAGFQVKHMPIPQRFEGNGLSVSVPQFNIPKEVTNYRMLKQFIAEKFSVTPDMVIKLGESYFTHIGITPHRIHPFAITAPPDAFKNPGTRFMPVYQYMLLWKSLSKEQHFMTTIARAYRYLPEHMKLQAKKDVKIILDQMFKQAQPDWSLPEPVAPTKAQAVRMRKQVEALENEPPPLAAPKKPTQGDLNKQKELERKERKKKRRLGLLGKKEDQKLEAESVESDPDSLEEDNQTKKDFDKKAEIAEPEVEVDVDMVSDFEQEIEDLRDALDQDLEDDDKPRPEKW